MDLTFQDIARWTADDVNAQILAILPEGWKFDLQTHPDHWRAAYKAENDVEVWTDTHWELRLLLLNAFAWLWQRRTQTRVHPAWRPQPSRPLVPIRPSDQSVPEPEDLDPGHIKSVYAAHARKYGKETG